MKITRCLLPIAGLFFSSALSAADAPKVDAKAAAKLVAEGKAVLVDCREPAELKESGLAAPAVHLPKSDFDGDQTHWKAFLAQNQDKQVILYCRGGGRASAIAASLNEKGVKAGSIGGLKDWTSAGLPTRPADAPATPPASKK